MKIGLEKEDYHLFVKDALENSIVVGGACRQNCIFCSCKAQNAAGRKNWTNYISEADLDNIIDYINPNNIIYFGEGPSFLSCEPFQHPEYVKLLEKLNTYFPNTKKMTTTVGKWIKPQDYELFRKTNMKFVVSINTLDKNLRTKVIRSEDDYYGLIDFLHYCEDCIEKISFLYLGDIDVLKKDLEILFKINPKYEQKELMLRLPDYSKYHIKSMEMLHEKAKKTWYEAIHIFDEVNYPSYWIRSLSDFPDNVKDRPIPYNIHQARREFNNDMQLSFEFLEKNLLNIEEAAFLFPESTFHYAQEKYKDINKIFVKNLHFGGSYTIASMLTLNDILNAILKEKKYKHYIAPLKIFNRYLRDLLNNHANFDYPIKLILV